MREAGYVQARLFNNDQIKQLNETVNKSLVTGQDKPSDGAIKSSQVKKSVSFTHILRLNRAGPRALQVLDLILVLIFDCNFLIICILSEY